MRGGGGEGGVHAVCTHHTQQNQVAMNGAVSTNDTVDAPLAGGGGGPHGSARPRSRASQLSSPVDRWAACRSAAATATARSPMPGRDGSSDCEARKLAGLRAGSSGSKAHVLNIGTWLDLEI